jgi:Spy/CpxP family protein refolding chaperone
MASAVIGALRVNLGIDSAQFTTGLKKANASLGGFAGGLKKVLLPLAALGSMTAIGAAIGSSFRTAIDTADQMHQAAQKFGVGVEELSRMSYAAGLADVSLEQLGTTLGRLSKNMAAAGDGGKQATAAFNSVGVAFKNADGSLRSSTEVLRSLADQFAATPDGAEKTAAAMALMGKSGAEMIPFLNQGAAGIAAIEAEADRLGVTIGEDTAAAADELKDNMDRLGAASRGLANRITFALLPALADIVEGTLRIASSWDRLPAVAAEVFDRCLQIVEAFVMSVRAAAADIPGAFVAAFQGVVHAAASAFSAVPGTIGETLIQPLKDADAALAGLGTSGVEEFNTGMSNAKWLMEDALRPLESLPPVAAAASGALNDLGQSFEGAAGGGGGGGGAAKLSEEAKKAAQALEDLKEAAHRVYEETRTPQEEYIQKLTELNALVQQGVLDQDTYTRAVVQAQDALADAGDKGTNAFKNLGDDFGDLVANVVQGTSSMKEGFASMLASIGGDLISTGIGGMFSNLFKGGGAAGGGGLLSFLGIKGFARGTPFAPGGLALVGERGPELLNLPRGSRVTPNSALGGSNVINFAPVYNVAGADAAQIAQLRAENQANVARLEATFGAKVQRATADPRFRGRV